jgi:hypothetical protein
MTETLYGEGISSPQKRRTRASYRLYSNIGVSEATKYNSSKKLEPWSHIAWS